MSKEPNFIKVQNAFAGHIKNPSSIDRPTDVDDRHMAIYRDLFFNNVMGFLSGTFPVLAEIVGDARWKEIGRDFFSKHKNVTPYFLEISREFLIYLEKEYRFKEGDPAYFYELAHYEWLELYVDIEPEGAVELCDRNGDILNNIPLASPVVAGFVYQYPVHQISIDNPIPDPRQSALIVYRKRDDSVGFVESNSFTLQLLALLKEQELSGDLLLRKLLLQAGLADNHAAYEGGVETLMQWQELGIIVGTQLKGS